MIKTRRYTITAGSYSSYQIIAQVEGNATPALSTLYKQFKSEYFPEFDKLSKTRYELHTGFYEHIVEGEAKLRSEFEEGMACYAFIQWLIKRHGFIELKSDAFHLEF